MTFGREYLYNLVTGKIKGPQGVFLRGCLLILSWVYGLAVIILAGFYGLRRVRLSAKVISVGNITLGGTGKTTLVEYLSVKLSLAGKKVAVLSRGYKRDSTQTGAQGLGDEPAMLQGKLPNVSVIVDKNRIKAARSAIKNQPFDIFILDDGFQQWKIAKDLEIVTLDAVNPFGNYRVLPAGFLREPLFVLKRADIFVLTQVYSDQDLGGVTAKLKRLNPRALIVESIHEPQGFSRLDQTGKLLDPGFLKGKSVAIFSGIGNPDGFQNCVCGLGIKVVRSFRFADHYNYTQADIWRMVQEARDNNLEAIITTDKDAVKIRGLEALGMEILVLEIKLKITKNEAEFDRRLLKLYSF
jgi:tetraacyldisaccharide 4'-kinase